tara:strand:- start:778 stop:1008 length:231 start_codon:yes stop_codon:yes gene_type:complete
MSEYFFIDNYLRGNIGMDNEKELMNLIEQNKTLAEMLETSRRELAESVRAEVGLQCEVNELLRQLKDLNKIINKGE